ncbi:MAG: phosphotransferase family protein [Actinobacteria bacterium]|nr:phosphotransferase family protein [Actinomycetota bacterium]
MAIAAGQRDRETVRAGLERWLARDGDAVVVGALEAPAAGLSSDTLFARVERASGSEQIVLRLPPAGEGLFPAYDLGRQARVQQELAEVGYPVAAPVIHEPDPAWLGAPFLVMPRVAGRVLLANPSFLASGWLHDAGRESQRGLLDGFLATLAGLHRLDPGRFGFLAAGVPPSLAGEVVRWSDYLTWACGEVAPPGYLADALAWCVRHRPDPEPRASVCWGDVQLVNAVFAADGAVDAVLDWEMCGLGPAEMDLGWFLALHGMMVAAQGGDLPGFGDRAGMVARYEGMLGRAVEELTWYEAFALVRSGSIMVRIARLLAAQGVDDSWLTHGNPTQAALDRLLG